MTDLPALLDRLLEAAPHTDAVLELAEAMGWTMIRQDNTGGGKPWVLLAGPAGPVLKEKWASPHIVTERRCAQASADTLYRSLLVALLRGLLRERECDVACAAFAATARRGKAA